MNRAPATGRVRPQRMPRNLTLGAQLPPGGDPGRRAPRFLAATPQLRAQTSPGARSQAELLKQAVHLSAARVSRRRWRAPAQPGASLGLLSETAAPPVAQCRAAPVVQRPAVVLPPSRRPSSISSDTSRTRASLSGSPPGRLAPAVDAPRLRRGGRRCPPARRCGARR
jgi:hypothetical protein